MQQKISPSNYCFNFKKIFYEFKSYKKSNNLFFKKISMLVLIGGLFTFGNAYAESGMTQFNDFYKKQLRELDNKKISKLTQNQCKYYFNRMLSKEPIPKKPAGDIFVVGNFYEVDSDMIERINEQLNSLYVEQGISVYVFKLPSFYFMSSMCEKFPYIDWYISDLVETWELDEEKHEQDILFIFSGKKNTSIRLGAGRDVEEQKKVQVILEKLVYRNLSDGEVSLAVYDGINGIDAMVRGDKLLRRSIPLRKIAIAIFIIIGILGAVAFLSLVVKNFRKGDEYMGSGGFVDGDGGGGGDGGC